MKHHKYSWVAFAVGITKVHCLAFRAHACETGVTEQMHLNKSYFCFYYHSNYIIKLNLTFLITQLIFCGSKKGVFTEVLLDPTVINNIQGFPQ